MFQPVISIDRTPCLLPCYPGLLHIQTALHIGGQWIEPHSNSWPQPPADSILEPPIIQPARWK